MLDWMHAHGRHRAEGGSKHRGNVEGIRKYRVNDPSEKRDRRGRRHIEQRANPCRGVAASVSRRTPILYASAQLRPARDIFHLHFKDRNRLEAGSGEARSDPNWLGRWPAASPPSTKQNARDQAGVPDAWLGANRVTASVCPCTTKWRRR